ncbi:MAG TPA: lysozyme inhibitor LprI family protein [Blastocatellia bacterium]|nr:lysozyme inhibitor LprI family protein [Blastocatellia bacterium]
MKKNLKRAVLFAAIFLMLMSIGAFTQTKKKADPCDSATNQVEMNNCAEREFKAADAQLNKVYNQVMTKLEGEHKTKLKEAELAWIKYRDTNCDCETFLNLGGTIYPLVYNGCLTRMTNNRIKELKDLLDEVK